MIKKTVVNAVNTIRPLDPRSDKEIWLLGQQYDGGTFHFPNEEEY